MAHKSLVDITAAAQSLSEQIQKQGINAMDRPSIVTAAKNLLALITDLQPHVNDAHSAFGNQDVNVAKVNSLRNTLNKIIATYSA